MINKLANRTTDPFSQRCRIVLHDVDLDHKPEDLALANRYFENLFSSRVKVLLNLRGCQSCRVLGPGLGTFRDIYGPEAPGSGTFWRLGEGPFTTDDAARELGVTMSTVHRWLREGVQVGEGLTPGAVADRARRGGPSASFGE